MTQIACPPVHLPSMLFFTFPTVSERWDQSGAIGPSQWKGIAENYSLLSEVGATLTDPWTDS